MYTPCNSQFYYIKVEFKGIKIIWVCFRDAPGCPWNKETRGGRVIDSFLEELYRSSGCHSAQVSVGRYIYQIMLYFVLQTESGVNSSNFQLLPVEVF